MCRATPDGGPPGNVGGAAGQVADRGIGGTGSPTKPSLLADRGIGGTGGTGIIAVITGFASVCLADREVAVDPGVPVEVDGVAGSFAGLHAGDVAAVEAFGPPAMPRALSIRVRHEVSGPVERIGAPKDDGSLPLIVAGQPVMLTPETWGTRDPRVGDWISVSGLRNGDGVIQASRIDPRPPGIVIVHGIVERAAGVARIGALQLRSSGGLGLQNGQFATVFGRYEAGMLIVDIATLDILAADPVGYFGDSVGFVVVETDAFVSGGRVRLGGGREYLVPATMENGPHRDAFVEFERRPNGSFQPTGLRERTRPFAGPAATGGFAAPLARPHFESAPMPNHGARAGFEGAGRNATRPLDTQGRGGRAGREGDGRFREGGPGQR